MDQLSETWRWAIGGLLSALLAAVAWIARLSSDDRAKLHARIDQLVLDEARAHQQFATREDITQLRAHIDGRFGELLAAVLRRGDDG